MQKKHLETLTEIFEKPTRSNIVWKDIEKMLQAFGAEISEGNGSRVRIALKGVRAVFQDKGALSSMRRFLEEAGIKP